MRCKAMKEANTLQGESKNHSPLSQHSEDLQTVNILFLLFLCFYIY